MSRGYFGFAAAKDSTSSIWVPYRDLNAGSYMLVIRYYLSSEGDTRPLFTALLFLLTSVIT
jgi:hypothetical protein